MAKNTKNLKPSPFHKGAKKRKREGEASDEWGVQAASRDADQSFKDFQGLKEGAGENLWAGAENLIDIGEIGRAHV